MQSRFHRHVCAVCTLALAFFVAAPVLAWAEDEEISVTSNVPAIEATLDDQDDPKPSATVAETDSVADTEPTSNDETPSAVEDETIIDVQESDSVEVDTATSEEAAETESSDEQTVAKDDASIPETVAPDSDSEIATTTDSDVTPSTPAPSVSATQKTSDSSETASLKAQASDDDSNRNIASDSSETASLKAQASDDDSNRNIADGVYVFNTALKNKSLISTNKNATRAGTNVQINEDDGSYYQRWVVRHVVDGYYTIVQRGTNMALSILGNKSTSGTNVQLATNTRADGQLWKFVSKSNGYYQLVSKLRSSLVLDVAGAKSANGTNIQVANNNGGKGQQFKLFKANAASKSTVSLDDATYTIRYAANTNYLVDIAGGSRESGANAQLYRSSGSPRQKFRFISDGEGYYIITDIASGKVLSTENASVLSGNNIKQANYTGSAIQKWAVQKNGGSYRIVNKSTGLSLALKGGTVANKSNIHGMVNSNSNAQKFEIKRTRTIADGIYTINSLKSYSSVFNMKGGSSADYTPVQLQTADNMKLAQRFQVLYVGLVGGEEIYRIRTAASGGWLTYTNAKGLMQYGDHATKVHDANSWKVISNGSYFSLSNAASGRVFNLKGGNTADGTAVQAIAPDKSAEQHFYFTPTNLLGNGSYRLFSGLSTTTLSVKGASEASGANVQANGKTGGLYQMFTLSSTAKTNSTYYLTNVNSGKVVAVANGAKTRGANVVQNMKTGAKSEQWVAQISDGGYVRFVNVNSGLILAVAGNSKRAGANVQQNAARAVDGQRWQPVPTGWSIANGWYEFYDNNGVKISEYHEFRNGVKTPGWHVSAYDSWNRIKRMSSGTKYLGSVDKDRTWTTFFEKRGGIWVPCNEWKCSVGKDSSPTPSGVFRTNGLKFKTNPQNDWFICWYWTCFQKDRGFHSIPCYPGTTKPCWGGLGERNSGGCVRSPIEKAKWAYDNINKGTKIYIY